jgi:hypothetical protein
MDWKGQKPMIDRSEGRRKRIAGGPSLESTGCESGEQLAFSEKAA